MERKSEGDWIYLNNRNDKWVVIAADSWQL